MELINFSQILNLIAALVFVLALMGGLALLLKKFGFAQGAVMKPGQPKRLKIVETLALDPRRRAVLIRCDDTEHLVILGPNGETVVKTDLCNRNESKDD